MKRHGNAKLCRFGRPAELICPKSFVPVAGLKCSYGKIFIPVAEVSAVETEISVTGKEIGVKRDLGNRISLLRGLFMGRHATSVALPPQKKKKKEVFGDKN